MRKTLVVVADDHAGSPVALPPNGDSWDFIDDGPKPFCDWQLTLWQHWCECWQHVADLRKGGQLIVVHAGDAVEGVHHQTVQLATQRIDEQERMHISAMQTGLELAKWHRAKDRLIYLTGTEVHVGNGNSSTERIARALLQTKKLDGSVIQSDLYKTVNGVLFDVAHKGYKLSSRRWTLTNGIRLALMDAYFNALEDHEPMPRYVVRAHQHTFGYDVLLDKNRRVVSEGFLMPAFKMPDDYVKGFKPRAPGNIGLLVFVVESSGASKDYPLVMTCKPDVVSEL